MTLTLTPPRVAAAPPAVRRGIGWLLPFGWLAQVVIRIVAFWHAHSPAAYPDEAGYLLAARWLSGGPAADLSHATFYQGGYPLLLTPIFWVTDDPALAYRLAIAVGAVVAATVFPLAVMILRRLGVRGAPVIAFAVALLPANVFFGSCALTDAILPALVCGWLLALIRFADTGRLRYGCAASLAAGYAYATHSRGTVIIVVHLVALAFPLMRHRRNTAVAMTVAATVWVASNRLNALLLHALYPHDARDLDALLWSRLTTPDGLLRTLSCASGQLWYLIVATYGLAGLGLVACAVAWRTDRSLRLVAGAVVAATVGIALASSAALPDEHRIGNFVYGRYLACLAVPLTLAGAALLVRAGRRLVAGGALATAGLLAGSALAVVAYAGPLLHRYAFIGYDFPETSYLTQNRHSLDMLGAGVSAAVLCACVILLRGRVLLVAALLLAVNAGFLAQMRSTAKRSAQAAPLHTGGVELGPDVGWRAEFEMSYRVSWTTPHRVASSGPRPETCLLIGATSPGWRPGTWQGVPVAVRPGCR